MSSNPSENQVTTEYTLATAAKDVNTDGLFVQDGATGSRTGLKQGHKCCGGCCDMRRAVIIVNIVNASLLLLGIFGLLALVRIDPSTFDDDELKQSLSSIDNASVGILIAISAVKVLLNCAGIVGALRYNIYLVGACAAVYCMETATALFFVNIPNLVYSALFAYPHFFFIREGTLVCAAIDICQFS